MQRETSVRRRRERAEGGAWESQGVSECGRIATYRGEGRDGMVVGPNPHPPGFVENRPHYKTGGGGHGIWF